MKKQLIIMILSLPLFSFEFDFSLPPVQEEVFEPSVQEQDTKPKPLYDKRTNRPTEYTSQPRQVEESRDIYLLYAQKSD